VRSQNECTAVVGESYAFGVIVWSSSRLTSSNKDFIFVSRRRRGGKSGLVETAADARREEEVVIFGSARLIDKGSFLGLRGGRIERELNRSRASRDCLAVTREVDVEDVGPK